MASFQVFRTCCNTKYDDARWNFFSLCTEENEMVKTLQLKVSCCYSEFDRLNFSLSLSPPQKQNELKLFFHIVEENITKLSKMKSQQRNEGLWERREEISGVEANSNENCYNDLHNFSLKNITLCSSILFVIIFCFKFILSCFSILLGFLSLEQTGYDGKWEKVQNSTKTEELKQISIFYVFQRAQLFQPSSADFDARVNMRG